MNMFNKSCYSWNCIKQVLGTSRSLEVACSKSDHEAAAVAPDSAQFLVAFMVRGHEKIVSSAIFGSVYRERNSYKDTHKKWNK